MISRVVMIKLIMSWPWELRNSVSDVIVYRSFCGPSIRYMKKNKYFIVCAVELWSCMIQSRVDPAGEPGGRGSSSFARGVGRARVGGWAGDVLLGGVGRRE